MLKPRVLQPGDTVGVVAPASPPLDPEAVPRGIAALEEMGLRVRLGRHTLDRDGYLAGGDRERAADLMEMFLDPAVRAVFSLRGGYGSGRILPLLDFAAIRCNPKIFVGYSDITALHLAIHRLAGLVTFHGPMVAADLGGGLSAYSAGHLRRALFEPAPLGAMGKPPDAPGLVSVRGGRASGRLVGGNLSLVVAGLGTPYAIETEGKILFLEDVGEEPYRIDRMLTHLRHSGRLGEAAGIVFGECAGCETSGARPAYPGAPDVQEVVTRALAPLGVPALFGLTIGHGTHKATLPLGVRATLDADAAVLTIEEAATLP